tara:strand:+ start:4408 stop:5580 length:1173 start_codon:yes stop_codon:yes gene_type:complete
MQRAVIIGSGLSGLSAAHYLDKSIYDVSVYEKEAFVGGRASSIDIDGFICDVGFQVLLDNYDEVKKLGIYNSLDLRYFDSGAQIYTESGILSVYNPIKHPLKFLRSNFTKIFKVKDYFSLVYILLKRKKTNHKSANRIFQAYFSEKSQKLFLRPFFKGIFLSKDLKVSPYFFLKIFKKFAAGRASIPKKGMGELSKKMSQKIKAKISFNHEAIKIKDGTVLFKNGKKIKYDILIFAALPKSINGVVGKDLKMNYNFNKTIYFKSKKNVLKKSILLIGENNYSINSIQCLSNISKDYSRNGWHLYSVSSIKSNVSDKIIAQEFQKILSIQSSDFELIKSISLKYALPSTIKKESNLGNIHFCGDWTTEPSIDGAIKSGRTLAENLNQLVES